VRGRIASRSDYRRLSALVKHMIYERTGRYEHLDSNVSATSKNVRSVDSRDNSNPACVRALIRIASVPLGRKSVCRQRILIALRSLPNSLPPFASFLCSNRLSVNICNDLTIDGAICSGTNSQLRCRSAY
jgi:hypothetical protein